MTDIVQVGMLFYFIGNNAQFIEEWALPAYTELAVLKRDNKFTPESARNVLDPLVRRAAKKYAFKYGVNAKAFTEEVIKACANDVLRMFEAGWAAGRFHDLLSPHPFGRA
jgi:hypothetical protein